MTYAESAARKDAVRFARDFDTVPAKEWHRRVDENFVRAVDTFGLNQEQSDELKAEYQRIVLEECKRIARGSR